MTRKQTKRIPSKAPLIPRSRIMTTAMRNVDYELRCARDYGVGCEIQSFGLPDVLSSDYRPALKRMAKRLDAIKGPIGFHGAFIDTTHYSADPEIRAVSRKRYLEAFDIAEELGAKYVLFHSQYNPIIRVEVYPTIYRNGSLEFWPEIVEEAERRKTPIYIENMFDDSPDPLCEVAVALDSPYFRLCLDISHAELFSDIDLTAWIDSFGPYLSHVHVNDCHGENDDHLGLGMGVLDIPRALSLLKKTRLPLTYALETGKHTAKSLRYLGLSKLK